MIRLTAKITANPVNQCGLIAGAIGGESVILLVLFNAILLRTFVMENLSSSSIFFVIWNIIYPVLIICIFEGWGAFALWMGNDVIHSMTDALITGFISGVLIGVLLEIMWIAQVIRIVSLQWGQFSPLFSGYGNVIFTSGALVILVLFGGILSAFGAYLCFISLHRSENPC